MKINGEWFSPGPWVPVYHTPLLWFSPSVSGCFFCSLISSRQEECLCPLVFLTAVPHQGRLAPNVISFWSLAFHFPLFFCGKCSFKTAVRVRWAISHLILFSCRFCWCGEQAPRPCRALPRVGLMGSPGLPSAPLASCPCSLPSFLSFLCPFLTSLSALSTPGQAFCCC